MINFNGICKKLKRLFNNTMVVPEFLEDVKNRYVVVFSGVVQGVGFRYEMYLIAKKIDVTGFVENLPNGDVYAEIQGAENRIRYLIDYMRNNKRFCVDKIEMQKMEIKDEVEFEAIY